MVCVPTTEVPAQHPFVSFSGPKGHLVPSEVSGRGYALAGIPGEVAVETRGRHRDGQFTELGGESELAS
jgi:hypothetical protein